MKAKRYKHLFWVGEWDVSVGYDIRDTWIGCYWDWSMGTPLLEHRYLDIYIILFPMLVLRLGKKFDGWTKFTLLMDRLFDDGD